MINTGDVFRDIESLPGNWKVIRIRATRYGNDAVLECIEYGCPNITYSVKYLLNFCTKVDTMIPYFKPNLSATNNYMFWINSSHNQYKHVVKNSPSFDLALKEYIRNIPKKAAAERINEIRYIKLDKEEEILA